MQTSRSQVGEAVIGIMVSDWPCVPVVIGIAIRSEGEDNAISLTLEEWEHTKEVVDRLVKAHQEES